ncbi:MAG TPA: tetratricopeptide repeat protein [archaeon]|nr:tetratricopeptide repeat protein [archaeon]
MVQKILDALESGILSAEESLKAGMALAPGTIETLVSEFEEALAYGAMPPRKRALKLAERAVYLLKSQQEKVSGKMSDLRALARWKSRLFQAMLHREEALEQAKHFEALTLKDSPPLELAEALIFLAKACYWSDNQRGTVLFQRRALDLVDRERKQGGLTHEDEIRFNKEYTVWAFRYAQNTCRWSEAYKTFEQAYRLAHRSGDPGLLSSTLVLYAEARMFQGDWEGCEKLAGECVQAALKEPGGPGSDYPFWIWGRALVHIGKAEQAVPELQKSISLARNIGDAVGLSEALVSLAEAHLALGESDQAQSCASQSEEVARYARLGINLAQIRIWRSWIEMELDSRSAVRQLSPLHQSLADFERLGCRSGWACTLGALGHALALASAPMKAKFYLERAFQAFREWDMPWHAARAEKSLSLIS